MPIYEYACEKCNSEFELLVRNDEKPACPDCGNKKLAKQFSVPAAHSAGEGGLPMMPPGGGCGKPQCGQGQCMGGM